MGSPDPPLIAHQPRVAGRGAQLPGFRLLLPRPVERGAVGALRRRQIALEREHPTLDPEGFGIIIALFPARPLDLRDDVVDQIERSFEIAESGPSLGQHGFPIGSVGSTTARLPAGDAPPEQSDPFFVPDLPDQSWT